MSNSKILALIEKSRDEKTINRVDEEDKPHDLSFNDHFAYDNDRARQENKWNGRITKKMVENNESINLGRSNETLKRSHWSPDNGEFWNKEYKDRGTFTIVGKGIIDSIF